MVEGPMKTWMIVTSGERPLAEVSRDLAKAGLTNIALLEAIGCITGDTKGEGAARLRRVKGVSDVSESPGIQLPPGEASETW